MLNLYKILSFILIIKLNFNLIDCHGRLWDPVSRSSAWRKGFKTPVNYDDTSLYCGGYSTFYLNKAKCGICGDAYTGHRPNEIGGSGVTKPATIVRTYKKNQIINVQVDLTANHKGFFVFQICPVKNEKTEVTESCLNKNNLDLIELNSNYIKYRFDDKDNRDNGGKDDDDDVENYIGNSLSLKNIDKSKEDLDDLSPDKIKKLLKSQFNEFTDLFNQSSKFNSNEIDISAFLDDKEQLNSEEEKTKNKENNFFFKKFGQFHHVQNDDKNIFNPVGNDKNFKKFKYYVGAKNGIYSIKVRLPRNLTCNHCVFRWIYVAGNSWGECGNGEGRNGCGLQEEFRNCADIAIH